MLELLIIIVCGAIGGVIGLSLLYGAMLLFLLVFDRDGTYR